MDYKNVLQKKNVKFKVLITGNNSTKGADVIADFLKKNKNYNIVLGLQGKQTLKRLE